jgi:hypothetical protein
MLLNVMSNSEQVFIRVQSKELMSRLNEPRHLIQVVAGPRQVGKTTMVQQVRDQLKVESHYISADNPTLQPESWLISQWDIARDIADSSSEKSAVLVIDEVQKIIQWSEIVKKLWDEDTAAGRILKVVLLGSAPLHIQKGLTESLMGRFEILRLPQWTLGELQQEFGITVDEYIYFGAYPGAEHLIRDPDRWRRYILDSIIEPTVSKDVLLLSRVDKPILLRRLLEIGCSYSGQLLSLTKILGQLHDAGNVTTLSHYLELLSGAGMVNGLQKFTSNKLRQRKSVPKFQVFNNALMSVQKYNTIEEAKSDGTYWGRLTESCIGAYLANAAMIGECELFYWREGNREVDFVIRRGEITIPIEVGTGEKTRSRMHGMDFFAKTFSPSRLILIGKGGISIEDFLLKPIPSWFE